MTLQQAQETIAQLEEAVRFWQAAYRKAIRRDDVIIRKLSEAQDTPEWKVARH